MTNRHVTEVLTRARSQLRRRAPREAVDAQAAGAIIVDTRPEYQRRVDGDIPDAIVVERNHLEWRLDPCSPSRIAEADNHDIHWIILCDEGYSSSLAAASLHAVGLVNATDIDGGFQRWRSDGCPVATGNPPTPPRVADYDTRANS